MDTGGERLEIYKLAVEMADRVSARRAAANSFFATVNGALAAVVGLAGWAKRSSTFGLVVTALAGITLSMTWWLLLRYYRRLNKAKFEAINDIEARLTEQPFTAEWAALRPPEDPRAVTKKKIRDRWKSKHREATVVEQFVPWVFVALYVALGIGAVLR